MRFVPSAVSAVDSYVSGLDALRFPQFVIDAIDDVECLLLSFVGVDAENCPSDLETECGALCYELSTAIDYFRSLFPTLGAGVELPESMLVLIRLHELLSAIFVE